MLNKIAHKTQQKKTNEENEEIKLLQPLSQFPLKSAHVCWLFFGSLAGFVVRGKRGGEEEKELTLKLHRFGCVVIGQFSKQRRQQADKCRAGGMRVCVL